MFIIEYSTEDLDVPKSSQIFQEHFNAWYLTSILANRGFFLRAQSLIFLDLSICILTTGFLRPFVVISSH